jgi:hypothetical protein
MNSEVNKLFEKGSRTFSPSISVNLKGEEYRSPFKSSVELEGLHIDQLIKHKEQELTQINDLRVKTLENIILEKLRIIEDLQIQKKQ